MVASYSTVGHLWNPNIRDHVLHNSSPSMHILSQTRPLHTLPTQFLKTQSYINLPPKNTNRFYTSSLLLGFPDHACYISHPSHPPWFHRPINVSCKIKINSRFIMRFFSSFPFLSLTQFPQHDFSPAANLCCVISVRDRHVCINPQWITEIPLTKETTVGRNTNECRVLAKKISSDTGQHFWRYVKTAFGK